MGHKFCEVERTNFILRKEMRSVKIVNRLKDGTLIFDGAMGTMLQNRGLKLGELPEMLNFSAPEIVIEIHKSYVDAGADVVTTNTFGANELKLAGSPYTVEEVIHKAVVNARTACEGTDTYVALDIGPIGELLAPMGTLSFQEAYEIFKRQVVQGVKSGADLILIETMTDLYEAKAAVLAAKENANVPVFCTMSFEANGRTFTGCTPEAMVLVLEGLGVNALGVNCSLGPKELGPIVDHILKIATVPVMVQANAGLPTVVEGRTVFNVLPEDFARHGCNFVEKGVKIVGGCCGTTDRYIEGLKEVLKDRQPGKIEAATLTGVCTPTKVVEIQGVRVIGERINPTGKKLLKEALRSGNLDYILREAIAQVDAGAHILDVNVGLPEINEEEIMEKIVQEIQSILDVPLQIDSTNPKAIEKGLRIYNGKAIVNSVNGEDKVLERILPIVKKYGAAVVGLTLDERGIPKTAEARFEIAEKIVDRALSYGIKREDVYIDCLTLTAAAQQEEVQETLKTIQLVKKHLNVKTVLGVSNVSFGLPNRDLLNRTFLAASIFAGLDLPIINPLDQGMMETIVASQVLWNQDKSAEAYLKYHQNQPKTEVGSKPKMAQSQEDLFNMIIKGIRDEAKIATENLLQEKAPLDIVNQYIVPALDFVGERYEKGDLFLPQLIQSAETVKSAFEVIKKKLKENAHSDISNGKILLATVKGDIHDIGKNIVKVLLENYNYEIIDLGRDVPKEKIVEEVVKNKIKLVGLSALMTTTVKNMEETIEALKKMDPECIVMVGGAVLNPEYAEMIKADYYAKDAKDAVAIAKNILG